MSHSRFVVRVLLPGMIMIILIECIWNHLLYKFNGRISIKGMITIAFRLPVNPNFLDDFFVERTDQRLSPSDDQSFD